MKPRQPSLAAFATAAMSVLTCAVWFAIPAAVAQEKEIPAEPPTKLFLEKPFDHIVLNSENGNQTLKVFPLELPNRIVPRPFPTGSLQVRLVDRPTQLFNVKWSDIAEVKLFDAVLLDEAARLTKQGKFDDAFDYYSHLLQNFPQLTDLNPAVDFFLQQDALAAYKAGQYDRSLAMLISLHERNPEFAGLGKAIDSVGGKIIERQLAERQYSAARTTLEVLSSQFPTLKLEAVPVWRQRFSAAAAKKLAEAEKLIASGEFVEARRAIGQAVWIWPDAEKAKELLAAITTAYPVVFVGVFELPPADLTPRIDSWPSQRCSRLTQRSLTELVDYGSEGGVYASPLGSHVQDTTGSTLTLQIEPQALNSDAIPTVTAAVARMLLTFADIRRLSSVSRFVERLASVRLEFPDKVHLDFAKRHVRPDALLQFPLPREVAGHLAGKLYSQGPRKENSLRFEKPKAANGAGQVNVQYIEEIVFPDDDAAIAALLRGEIDLLDRVPPWQLVKLKTQPSVRVGTYRLPTVHVIIPNPQNKLASQREFRRALVYGIDREKIASDILLGGETIPGFQTISGPFPAGISQSDPVRYAYNNQIQPHAYDPRLASLLATVAWNNVAKPRKAEGGEEGTTETVEEIPLPAMRLAHSSDPVARTACQTIKLQLDAIGIPITLVEVSSDAIGDDQYDLRYAELAVWEPLVDAARILGVDGVAGTTTDYMVGALGKLEAATTWNQVQTALHGIHELAHSDLHVIPLWQTVNYFAYRSDFQGVAESPIVLYQNVENWQNAAKTAQVQ